MYGELRREAAEVTKSLVEREDGVEIVEGSACPNHIRSCLRIPRKYGVCKVVGRLKDRSSTMPCERHPESWVFNPALCAKRERQ